MRRVGLGGGLLAVASALYALLGPGVAQASPPFVTEVPNGSVNSCNTCHTGIPSPLNAFGVDVQGTLAGGVPDWSQIWDADSDGDNQLNGEELGDPCGVWTTGQTPARTTDISNPGDDQDLSADPTTPPCGDSDAGVPDAGPDDGGAPDAAVFEDAAVPEDCGCSDAAGRAPDPIGPTDGSGCACTGSNADARAALPLFFVLVFLFVTTRARTRRNVR